MGRVGPIGLIYELGADFIIVKEEYDKETQIYKRSIPHIAESLQLLKTTTLDKLPNQGFKKPGSPHPNGRFSISCRDIDWGAYDIVISVNVSIPKAIIQEYKNTIFCYMMGEANMATEKVKFGYDVTLNQMARGVVASQLGPVDFPYTFVKGDTLENIVREKYQKPIKKGIYVEINSCTERPVVNTPEQFEVIQKETGEEVVLHKQLIEENLLSVYKSKYYVKLGGRKTRGNGAIEAVSLGTLVIMDPSDIIHHEILAKETQCSSAQEIIALINKLNRDEEEYQRLLAIQRENVSKYMYDKPLESLINCLDDKRKRNEDGWVQRLMRNFRS